MCGIVGGNLPNESDIKKGLDIIIYRGRDASQYVLLDNGIYMGHNRLAIQDLDVSANQPMFSNDKSICVVYNGELWDGWQKQKKDLIDKGHKFNSNSDTELIVNLFKEHGESSFSMLDGMFSFALSDGKYLYLVRDWVGKLPFFYHIDNNGKIIFASEFKVLATLCDISFKEANVVQPGTYIKFDIERGVAEEHRYYEIPRMDVRDSFDEAATKVRELLMDGVKNRLISDVPVCTILSGGIDSAAITWCLKQLNPNIEAFVVSVGESGRRKDDLYYAKMVAEYLDIKLHEVIIDEKYLMDNLEKAIYVIEQNKWTQISPAIPQFALAKAISDNGFKVAFGGEGSDEIWGSYGHIRRWYYKDEDFDKVRFRLIENLHKTNLIRTNMAMMYGGTVELRVPFLHRPLVEYGLNLPVSYREKDKLMKPVLREAFKGLLPDEVVYRKKKTFQVGCHSDNLKDLKVEMKEIFNKHYEATQNII